MIKKILSAIVFSIFLISCNSKNTISYSNLTGKNSQNFIIKALKENGVSNENIDTLIKYIDLYNSTVNSDDLIDDFTKVDDINNIKYDLVQLNEKMLENSPNFVGTNCRITGFTILNGFVNVDKNSKINGNSDFMFLDKEALETAPIPLFEIDVFEKLFSSINTEHTKDYKIHVNNIEKELKNRGVKFLNSKISLISVFFHSDLDKPDILFVGHDGILMEYNNKLLFIEKLSPIEPYQAIIFNDRKELNKYLMTKYDLDYNQETSSPIIFENDHLMENYNILKKTR